MDASSLATFGAKPKYTDLSDFLEPDLVLRDSKGRDWTIQPPTRKTALLLSTIVAAATAEAAAIFDSDATVQRVQQVIEENAEIAPDDAQRAAEALMASKLVVNVPEIDPETKRLYEEHREDRLEEMSLGADIVAAMDEAGVPATHIDAMGKYALYYFLYGRDVADNMAALVAEAATAPKDSGKTSPTGQSTGSESPTSSASTPTTTSRTTSAPTGKGRQAGRRKAKRKR